jgi:hypothetical protein
MSDIFVKFAEDYFSSTRLNIPHLPQGPGWTPDGGVFWVRDNFIYWPDGDIWDMNKGQIPCRTWDPGNLDKTEDFSQWSDEKREAIRAQKEAECAEHKARIDAHYARIKEIAERVTAGFTQEEIDAVVEHFGEK